MIKRHILPNKGAGYLQTSSKLVSCARVAPDLLQSHQLTVTTFTSKLQNKMSGLKTTEDQAQGNDWRQTL